MCLIVPRRNKRGGEGGGIWRNFCVSVFTHLAPDQGLPVVSQFQLIESYYSLSHPKLTSSWRVRVNVHVVTERWITGTRYHPLRTGKEITQLHHLCRTDQSVVIDYKVISTY